MGTLNWHPGALLDFESSIAWYELESLGLGERFSKQVDAQCLKIILNSKACPFRKKDVRHCRLTDFPFHVVYVERSAAIWIVAVAHEKRHPDYWKTRLKDVP